MYPAKRHPFWSDFSVSIEGPTTLFCLLQSWFQARKTCFWYTQRIIVPGKTSYRLSEVSENCRFLCKRRASNITTVKDDGVSADDGTTGPENPILEVLRVKHVAPLWRDHFVYTLSQWETTLHCNVVSYWLGAYTKWSLLFVFAHVRVSSDALARPVSWSKARLTDPWMMRK